MKTIALVNTDESPCPGTHGAACREFLQGFTSYGFAVSEVSTLEDCVGKDILLLSNHKVDLNYLKLMNVLNPDAVYILWYYNDYIHELPFKRFILTSEHHYAAPTMPMHAKAYKLHTSIPNYVPFMLRANEEPSKIGSYLRMEEICGCFMGNYYCHEWQVGLPKSLYYTHARDNNRLLSYDERRDIYLKSMIAYGFNHEDNVSNNHVTQRTFEGMAYGCVVIGNSPSARDMTGGIVEYAANKEEFQEKFWYYVNNPEAREEKRRRGYEWVRAYGTNRYAAKLFLDKIHELWDISYAKSRTECMHVNISSYLSDCINNCDENTNGELSFYNSIKENIQTVFDVGCRSDSLFSNFKGVVHYFDPVESFIEKIKTVPNNNKESYFNSFGLSDKDETLWYYPLFQSFYNRVASCHKDDDANKVSLRVKNAKTYMLEHNVEKIDLLKIDTEGHELQVLQGFGDLLKRVNIIQFEYGGCNIDTQIHLIDIINHLKTHNFHNFSYLTYRNLKPLQDYDDHYQYSNIVCFNKDWN